MKASLGKSGLVAALGVILLAGQGCSSKWLQSDGDQAGGTAKMVIRR
jgi:hypothetical protein